MSQAQMIIEQLQTHYLQHHPLDAAQDLLALPIEQSVQVTQDLPEASLLPMLRKLPIDYLRELFEGYSNEAKQLRLLEILPTEKGASILEALSEEQKASFLEKLSSSKKDDLLEKMSYPPRTAGRLMDPLLISFFADMTVASAIEKIKQKAKTGIRVIFVVDHEGVLVGMIPIQKMMLSDPSTLLSKLLERVPSQVYAIAQEEEIVEQLEAHRLTDLPVVDLDNHLIGVVRYHTLVNITRSEATKDLQSMVGVSREERALSKVGFAVRKRLPWLEINLLTAFLAASVVGLFESTIAKYTALAVLLPVVAGQSGNTGAQALAVTMRGLTLKEVRLSHWFFLILKECRIALMTGVAVAIPTGLGVYFWSGSVGLMAIIGVSMVVSMVIAGASGAAVPMVLVKLKQDPASSSSIILTTVTDVFGFFSFLGIATALSRYI